MKSGMKVVIVMSLIFVISYLLVSKFLSQPIRESLTYFPIDPTVAFLTANSSLTLLSDKEQNYYEINWEVTAETDKKVYLRQDVSILFVDGVFSDAMYEWKENKALQNQKKMIKGQDSGLFETISFHHAEIHLDDHTIRSAQTMSEDKLYIIDSSFSPLQSFRKPANKEQEEWEKIINHVSTQHLNKSWSELIKYFQVEKSRYDSFTLLDLVDFNTTIPGLSEEKSQEVIGQLWEGLYKNYLLGIKLSESETISPVGSKLPLILLSKDRTHLLILIEGKNGEKAKLVQEI
jgi:hypothetical protein